MKTRSDSLEKKLNSLQLAQLTLWLGRHSYKKVQELIAAPPPAGFGIKTSITSLHRFYRAHRETIHAKQLEQAELSSQVLLAEKSLEHFPQHKLDQACARSVQERVFLNLHRGQPSVMDLSRLTRILTHTRNSPPSPPSAVHAKNILNSLPRPPFPKKE